MPVAPTVKQSRAIKIGMYWPINMNETGPKNDKANGINSRISLPLGLGINGKERMPIERHAIK